jgi:hypothetical protein
VRRFSMSLPDFSAVVSIREIRAPSGSRVERNCDERI